MTKGYEQTDIGEIYAHDGKRTTFRYLISLIGRYGWNMDHMEIVTAWLYPEIDDNDICMTLSDGWPEGLNTPKIILRLSKALYSLKQARQLCHDNINAFLLSLGFTQSSADPNLYLRSDALPILLFVDDMSISCPEAASNTEIEVNTKVSAKYQITNFGPVRQFFGVKIHHDGTRISLGQKASISTIL